MSTDERVNILMVDDQPAKLLSYEVMLAELGENLIKATSAKEALEILLKTDVAVVLMDVSMPELDGFELATMIRQHPRFQRTARADPHAYPREMMAAAANVGLLGLEIPPEYDGNAVPSVQIA